MSDAKSQLIDYPITCFYVSTSRWKQWFFAVSETCHVLSLFNDDSLRQIPLFTEPDNQLFACCITNNTLYILTKLGFSRTSQFDQANAEVKQLAVPPRQRKTNYMFSIDNALVLFGEPSACLPPASTFVDHFDLANETWSSSLTMINFDSIIPCLVHL